LRHLGGGEDPTAKVQKTPPRRCSILVSHDRAGEEVYMSKDFCHRKEEYISLRKEIEAMLLELSTLERSCVLAIAAVYAWLAAPIATHQSLSPFHSAVAWGAPFFLAFFGALRAYSINKHFGTVGEYISKIEDVTKKEDPTFEGWEHFFASDDRRGIQTRIRMWFWACLIAATLGIWAISWGHG
jgi:hypothetical protein